MPEASAVTIEGSQITRVQAPGAPPPTLRPDDRLIDLRGRTLLPGLVDAHTHLMHWGFRFLRPGLGGAANRAEVLDRIREAHRNLPPGRLLLGEGWDESGWPDPGFPTRQELDAIDAGRPMVIRRICGHMAVANSAALVHFPAGPDVDPTSGFLLEEASMGIARIFPPNADELDQALEAAERSYLSMGVTQVHDMCLPDHLRSFERAGTDGRLRLSIAAILPRQELDFLVDSGLGAGWHKGSVRLRGVKFFSDGSLGARTAALNSAYADRPGEAGALLLDSDALARDIARADGAGIPLAIHAIGDRAVAMVIAAFERGLSGRSSRVGHRIEHLEMVNAAELERVARLGLEASMQPNFVGNWGLPGGLYEQRLGVERTARMNPMSRVLAAGVRLVVGSDGMPAGVLPGLADAVAAPHAAQRLMVDQALAAATREAAHSGGFPDRGILRAGNCADLLVLSGCPPGSAIGHEAAEELRRARVEMVLTGGQVAFESLEMNPATARGGKG